MSEENKEKISDKEIYERIKKLKLIESEIEEKADELEKDEEAFRKKLKLPPSNDVFSKLTDLITQSYTLYVSEDENVYELVKDAIEVNSEVYSGVKDAKRCCNIEDTINLQWEDNKK